MDSKKIGLIIESASIIMLLITLGISEDWEVAGNLGILPTIFSFLRIRLFPTEQSYLSTPEFLVDIKSIYILILFLATLLYGEFLRRGVFTISAKEQENQAQK